MSDLTFQNNVPDPLLSGKELPTFKFELEKSKGKVLGNSFGKEATVEQLPISKGIAGVSMQLEAGVMRELHWHATAAEWAFVLKGRVRTTVINPAGQAETNDFEPGDIWYFPRGTPTCSSASATNRPISTTVTGVILDLEPGALRELHWHPNADEWQYVIEGDLSVTMFGSHGRFRTEQLNAGDVGYIPQGYGHSIENVGSKPSRMLIGFNTGIYQAIDLSAWLASNPADVLATNFGKRPSLFEKFPRKDVFISPNQ